MTKSHVYSCLLCQAEVPQGSSFDVACAVHVEEATISDGRSLSNLLMQLPNPAPRTALPYVLNPVSICGVRYFWQWWLDAPQFVGEKYASADYFEFAVQHGPAHLPLLQRIHDTCGNGSGWADGPQPVVTFLQNTAADPEALVRLSELWWKCSVVARARISHSEPPSAASIESMCKLALGARLPSDEVEHAVKAIVAVALKRIRA